jgi:hypothetical protein
MSETQTQRAGTEPVRSQVDERGEALRKIENILETLRFGSIEIVVHEGRVVQIERREKLRVR